MAKRTQTVAALVLGAAAVILAVCLVFRLHGSRPAAVTLAPADIPAVVAAPARLDLNTAAEEELRELPGIGEVLAGRIVQWREENGPFRTREDVLSVPGIGEGKYEAIEPFIAFGYQIETEDTDEDPGC